MKLTWKYLVVGFLLGAVVGAVGSQWCAPPFHWYWKGEREHIREKMLQRFNSRLNLTSDQQQKVAAILQEKQGKIDALRAQMRPKFEEIRNTTQVEIRQLLTPEQQGKFEAMIAEHKARMKKIGDRWGGKEMEGELR